MSQTVQIYRTTTNAAPAPLLPGVLSAQLGTFTKLWIGSATPVGNRLLLSNDPADPSIYPPLDTNGNLPLLGPYPPNALGPGFISTVGLTVSDAGLMFNAYVTGPAAWNYLTAGRAALINFDQTNGAFQWSIAPAGVAAAPAPLVIGMALDANANLDVVGSLRAENGVYPGVGVAAGFYIGVNAGTGNCIIQYSDPNNLDEWTVADGTRRWYGAPGGTPGPLMVLDNAGNLTLVTGNGYKALNGDLWNVASDVRIKKNITDYTAGLDQVCALRPVSFSYNGQGGVAETGNIEFGLVAQEAQSIMPEMVFNMDTEKYNLDGTVQQREATMLPGQLGMNRSPLIYALCNAVRELRDMMLALTPSP